MVAFLALLWLARGAQAAEHGVRMCLVFHDTRDDSDTSDRFVGVSDLPIEVWVKSVGIFWEAGSLTTNSSGCISGTLSGMGVPKKTTVKLKLKFKTDKIKVTDGDEDVYYVELDSKKVDKGEDADFGDIYVYTSTSPDYIHGALQLYDSVRMAQDAYVDVAGQSWPSRYDAVRVMYPVGESAQGGKAGIWIAEDEIESLSTVRHELGHFIYYNDVSDTDSDGDDYCNDKEAGAYPFDRFPYIYEDTSWDDEKGDCRHYYTSYETNRQAISEGFADFVDSALGKSCDAIAGSAYPLNFDENNREGNILKSLCDLIDSGSANDSHAVRHYYAPEGKFVDLGSTDFEYLASTMDGEYGYLSKGRRVYRVSIAGSGNDSRPILSILPWEPTAMAVGSSLLCAAQGSQIRCADKDEAGVPSEKREWTAIDPPEDAIGIYDLSMRGERLYALWRDRDERRHVSRIEPGGKGDWASVYDDGLRIEEKRVRDIAVDEDGRYLYLARASWIERCALGWKGSCSDEPSRFSGSTETAGYRRGAAEETYYSDIDDLYFVGNPLFVEDSNGVAKVSVLGKSEQFVGSGPSEIFNNNLHRRATQPTGAMMATDGTRGVLFLNGPVFDGSRDSTWVTQRMYRFDDSEGEKVETYCYRDEQAISAKKVLHLAQDRDEPNHLGDALEGISGLSSDEEEKVKQGSWAKLGTDGCEWEEGVEVTGETSGTVDQSIASSCGGSVRKTISKDQAASSGVRKLAKLDGLVKRSLSKEKLPSATRLVLESLSKSKVNWSED